MKVPKVKSPSAFAKATADRKSKVKNGAGSRAAFCPVPVLAGRVGFDFSRACLSRDVVAGEDVFVWAGGGVPV